tara:strand:- start:457 stop:1341 length:885 start_codon:yes stop_codon:yes gene_type:complete
MKNIILKGGLGNQLFQFSKFLDLKKNKNFKNLGIDSKTGFLLDFKYNRKLEIYSLKNKEVFKEHIISLINIFLIAVEEYLPYLNKLLDVCIIDDTKDINLYRIKKKHMIFNGYFQDYKIVKTNINELFKFIKPNFEMIYSDKFEDLYKNISFHKNSVAIGIRFYEESKNPLIHSSPSKRIKNVDNFNKVIAYYESLLIDPCFYIFVQEENLFTRNLIFNSPYHLVTHSKGYLGSWQRIKAQALCKHHIFNNSTFYFWGAIFSKFINQNKNISPKIFVSDNFIYDKIYDPSWEKF